LPPDGSGQDDTVSARGLGLVHRIVGAVQGIFDICVVLADFGDTDADGNRNPFISRRGRCYFGRRLTQSFRHLGGALTGRPRQDCGEFLSAYPGKKVSIMGDVL